LGQFHDLVSRYGQRPVNHLFNLSIADNFTDYTPGGLDFPGTRHSQKCRVG
jgi:hypothetical protein